MSTHFHIPNVNTPESEALRLSGPGAISRQKT